MSEEKARRRLKFSAFQLVKHMNPFTETYFGSSKKLCGVSSCIRYAQKAVLKSDESVNKDVMSPELFVVLDSDENRGICSKSGKSYFP